MTDQEIIDNFGMYVRWPSQTYNRVQPDSFAAAKRHTRDWWDEVKATRFGILVALQGYNAIVRLPQILDSPEVAVPARVLTLKP